MNSAEEKELLESHGWTYDTVKRVWIAVDGYELRLEDLVIATDMLGPEVERRLRQLAREHAA